MRSQGIISQTNRPGIGPGRISIGVNDVSIREAALSSDIRERLIHDKRVGDLPIYPYVVQSDVYLVGRVKTLEQKRVLEFIVSGTPGVRRVNLDEVEVEELAKSPAQ